MRRCRVAVAVVALMAALSALTVTQAHAANAVFSASLTRAPYVTDLTQTSAEVNWATTISTTAGSVQWVDQTAGGNCPTSPWVWSKTTKQTANASTQIPYGPGSGTLGWGFSVKFGARVSELSQADRPDRRSRVLLRSVLEQDQHCH